MQKKYILFKKGILKVLTSYMDSIMFFFLIWGGSTHIKGFPQRDTMAFHFKRGKVAEGSF